MLRQVMGLTQEQLNNLAPAQRAQVDQLRQYAVAQGLA